MPRPVGQGDFMQYQCLCLNFNKQRQIDGSLHQTYRNTFCKTSDLIRGVSLYILIYWFLLFKCCKISGKSILKVGFDVAAEAVSARPCSDSMSLRTCYRAWSVCSRSLGALLVSLWHYLLCCSQTSRLHDSQINQERLFFPTDNISLTLFWPLQHSAAAIQHPILFTHSPLRIRDRCCATCMQKQMNARPTQHGNKTCYYY